MRKLLFFCLLIITFFPLVVSAQGSSTIVIEQSSGRILYAQNAHQPLLVASTIKVLTAILAIESGRLYEEIEISDNVLKSYGSGIYVKPGEKLLLLDLVYGLMLRSGNDAALAIAKAVSGNETEFVKLMDEKAVLLGCKNNLFRNPSGLDNNGSNQVSAWCLATIYRYAMNNETFRQVSRTSKYPLKTNKNTYVWNNKNKMLKKYRYTTGGKTGFTKKSGKSLISSAKKKNMEIIIVTINNPGHYETHLSLYKKYFKKYQLVKIINHHNFKVPKDKLYKNSLSVREDLFYPLLQSEKKQIKTKVVLKRIKRPGKIGKIKVYLRKDLIGSVDIYYKKVKKE